MTKSLSAHRRTNRPGLTLVEVLVVVSIVGMLAAIAIPAVNAAREVGRRNTCTNNFHQFGTGIQAYESTNGKFPVQEILATPHSLLLPYLGYNDVYQASGRKYLEVIGYSMYYVDLAGLGKERIPIFRCPSDPGEILQPVEWPGNNIRVCSGVFDNNPYYSGIELHLWRMRSGPFNPWNNFLKSTGSRDIVDGMGRTLAASERLMGSGIGNGYSQRTDAIYTYIWTVTHFPDLDLMLSVCDSLASSPPDYFEESGATWGVWGYHCTMYNHVRTPNSRLPDCLASGPMTPKLIPSFEYQTSPGVMTASSNHPGGVNVLFLDGHTEFVINDVDLSIWRAYATRAAGD